MIKFDQVTKEFGEVKALDKVSFAVKGGEFVFLIGPSGAGKTTVFRLILRQFLSTSGVVEVIGMDLSQLSKKKIPALRRSIGVVFQDLKLLTDRTVFENVALALRIIGKKEEQINEETAKILKLVGLESRADFFPAQLAGGELQRVTLARAAVTNPDLILADEPTGNLDIGTARQIVDLLKKLNQKGKTVIMATHNFEIVNSFNERVIELEGGKLVSDKKKGKYQIT
jgi:cell division transport system ATP-binding protein